MKAKKYSTIAILLVMLLGTLCYLAYMDFEEVKSNTIQLESSHKSDRANLMSTIYYSLKRDAQFRTDTTKENARSEIVAAYSNNWEQFSYDYDNPSVTNNLDIILSKYMEKDKYFYVKSDANDKNVMTRKGVRDDFSTDCSSEGDSSRTFEQEYKKHFNLNLAIQAVSAILSNKNTDIFWQFSNNANLTTPKITNMSMNNIFYVDSLEDIRDIEFLVYSSIDDYSDILGVTDVSMLGQKQDNRKLYIVQGFNLYEQIQTNYSINFSQLEASYNEDVLRLQHEKEKIVLKFVLLLVTLLSTFISFGLMQNQCVRSGENRDNDGRCSN